MIRKAETKDTTEFCHVVRTSIVELCQLDYKGNKSRLSEWLENKTEENCNTWITDTNSNSFVAVQEGNIVGVSHIGHNGYLYLCYLLPSVKGIGLGSKLIIVAEQSIRNLGQSQVTLESTITAKGFYEHHGYQSIEATKNCLKYTKRVKP